MAQDIDIPFIVTTGSKETTVSSGQDTEIWDSANTHEGNNPTEQLKTGAEEPHRETLRWATPSFSPYH
jgi:hypothetical protein